MTGDELKEMRERLGMDRKEFGAYIANLISASKPYSYNRVAEFENSFRDIPSKVEVAFLRLEVTRLREELTKLSTK